MTIEDDICDLIRARAARGVEKYRQTMERTDLGRVDWLQHLIEELLDAAVYCRRAIEELDKQGKK